MTLPHWNLAPEQKPLQELLTRELEISALTAQVLINRGITNVDAAKRFLHPQLSELPDPFLLLNMQKAVDLTTAALADGKQIAIFGDYDVDGVSSTALLTHFFRTLGAKPISFIPHRLIDGYGMSKQGIDTLKAKGTDLIITVDNGIRSLEEIAYAKSCGLSVIVTDHHEPGDELPAADAIVNPKQAACPFPEKNICGCGVAFFFAMALRKRLREENFFTDHNEPHLAQYLDFVALGTVADVMPLTGANRIFVHFGLKQLNQSSHLGLRALISTSDCKGKITPTHVGFRLGPRINAAGRMESAQTALELFLSSQKENAYYLSGELERLNSLRQKTEEKILRGALHQLEDGSAEELAGITVFDASWHIGIAGIVASRLVDRFQVPSVVLAQEKETIRGSVRSPQGTNVLECLQACEHLLVQYGGHAQAAGVVIKEENIPAFKKLFEEVCAQKTKNTSLPKRNVDALVSPGILTENIIQELELLAPFGLGNPEPCFAVENIKLLRQSIVGKHHLKFQVKDEHTVTDAIAFGKADHEENIHLPHHITYRPEINHFRGKSTIQLKIKELIALDIPAENLE